MGTILESLPGLDISRAKNGYIKIELDYHADPAKRETGWVDAIKALIGAVPFRKEYLRDFEAYGGELVYDEVTEKHIIDPFDIPKGWTRVRGIDPGFINPLACIWVAVDYDGRLYAYQEHYEAKRLIPYHAAVIKAMSNDENMATFIDPSAGQRTIQAEKSVIEQFAEHGIGCTAVTTAKWPRVQRVKSYLSLQEDGKPMLYIFKNCENLRKELKTHRWKELTARQLETQSPKEEVIKKDEHAINALENVIETRPAIPVRPRLNPEGVTFQQALRKAQEKKYGHARATR